eukprot:134177_1
MRRNEMIETLEDDPPIEEKIEFIQDRNERIKSLHKFQQEMNIMTNESWNDGILSICITFSEDLNDIMVSGPDSLINSNSNELKKLLDNARNGLLPEIMANYKLRDEFVTNAKDIFTAKCYVRTENHIKCTHQKYHNILNSIQLNQTKVNYQMKNLIETGCCQLCSLIYILDIVESMKMYTIQSDRTAIYFAVSIAYLHAAKFIFNQSNLWILMLQSIGIVMEQIHNEQEASVSTHLFNILSIAMIQIIQNIRLLRKFHWEIIILNADYSIKWFLFLKKQLSTGYYMKFEVGKKCVEAMFILFCFILYFTDYYGLSVWRNWNTIISECDFASTVSRAITALRKNEYLAKTVDYFRKYAQKSFIRKWKNMKCENERCGNKRIELKKLFKKCKSCQVARYCSKHCQKIDWNQNDHKRICIKLRQISKDKNFIEHFRLLSFV